MRILAIIIIIFACFVFPYNLILGAIIFGMGLLLFFIPNRSSREQLEAIRARYTRQIEKYYKKNKMRLELKNKNLSLHFFMKNNSALFYCIDKINSEGFQFGGNGQKIKNITSTMWGLIDMKFTKNTTYNDINNLFEDIYPRNATYRSQDNPYRLFSKTLLPHTVNFRDKNYKLKIKTDKLDRQYIICSEISKDTKHKHRHKTGRRYIIQADNIILTEILYSYRYDSIKDFISSYELFSKLPDCTIKFDDLKYHLENNINDSVPAKTMLIDINNSLEDDFAKLPGITKILAKRIVRQRELINGFKTKKEFYEVCNLKPHFIEQIEQLITVGMYDIFDIILREDERTVDMIDDYEYKNGDDDFNDDEDNEIIVDI